MSNSPIDNPNTIYQVYFEVADQAQSIEALTQSPLAPTLNANIRTEKFGFYLSITNPTIPAVIKTLVAANQTIYQVKRQPVAADIGYMI